MVVRPSHLTHSSPENNSNSPSSTTSNNSNSMPAHSTVGSSPKRKNGNSMSRKRISMSPSRPMPRSKSMNGLNRLEANKPNGNGRSGRGKRDSSPLQRSNSRNSDTNNNGYVNGNE